MRAWYGIDHFPKDGKPVCATIGNYDGVHLGHEDVPISEARKILGHRKIIGASTHSVPEAIHAQKEGADYVSCGPIWAA